jgi:hypothetical protein
MTSVARRAHTRKGGTSQLGRTPLCALALVAVVGLSLLASACGGHSSGAKVAQVDTNKDTKGSGSSNVSGSGDPVAYSACMRSHGVGNFPDPDPDSNGRIKTAVSAGGRGASVDVHSPQFARARKACDKLRPNGGRPTAADEEKEQQQMLKFAQCMRSHGLPNFPDPKPGGSLTLGKQRGVDPDSPLFKAAQQTCQKLLPGGPMPVGPSGGGGPPPAP